MPLDASMDGQQQDGWIPEANERSICRPVARYVLSRDTQGRSLFLTLL